MPKHRSKFSRSVHASSDRHDWRTPARLVSLVREALGGVIDLDPCAGERTRIGRRNVTRAGDGLSIRWGGAVYVNPPYGRAIPLWIAKAIAETTAARERTARQIYRLRIVMLIPSRTDTRAFHAAAGACASACLLRGRLTFVGAPASAPFPSALFYFGADPAAFDRVFEGEGLIVRFTRRA